MEVGKRTQETARQAGRAFASWSGGKDGCLALYRALKSGIQVSHLLNMLSADGSRSASHSIRASVIRRQAEALGIPIVQRAAGQGNYEAVFIRTVEELKRQGISGGIFGDIDFHPHRQWIEKVCGQAGITPYLPLWGEDQQKLMEEFIATGFTAVVVAAKTSLFGQEFLGKTVDKDFLRHLEGRKDITPCGEAGEYHTLVIDGPIFKKRLEIIHAKIVTRGEHHFLEILRAGLSARKEGNHGQSNR